MLTVQPVTFLCIKCKSDIDPKYKACPYCGEAVTDFLRMHHDTPVDGKYQIVSCLGAGGMGEVYKVLHIHLNALRVIKLMRAKIAEDPDAHERFVREARLATKINHPNVATLFDFSTLADGARYMVWEYIQGKNLHELIHERGPLSPRHAATIAHDALLGLDAVHRAGIIHRDISPENIMVSTDEDGEEHVKIIDLGIAKQWGDEAHQTTTGVFVGKWKYCSPEHLGILDKGARIDARADLYSFGIVLYEMLTGVAPFQATTPHGFLQLHASERPPALHETNSTVKASPALETIIFRALEKDRDQRFATAREFARSLKPLIAELDDTPGVAPPPRMIEIVEDLTIPAELVQGDRATRETIQSSELESGGGDRNFAATEKAVEIDQESDPTLRVTITAPLPARTNRIRIAAVAAVVVIALVIAMVVGRRPGKVGPVATASAVPRAMAQRPSVLALNAYPWAEVKVIRNTKSGRELALSAPLVTPGPIELEPGTWEVHFTNPEFSAKPIVRVVEVGPGEERVVNVQFRDPAKAALPRFEGAAQ